MSQKSTRATTAPDSALKTLQDRAIKAEQEAGAEMFLGLPDKWYEPRPEYGCENGHVSTRYLKCEDNGALCLACQKPIAMIPHDYTDETLAAALAAIRAEVQPSPSTGGEPAMRECPDCDGSAKISMNEWCARCDRSGIVPAVAGGEPATDSDTADLPKLCAACLYDGACMRRIRMCGAGTRTLAAREPVPVARELPDAKECGFCDGARGAADNGYWVDCPVCVGDKARATAESAPASAAPREQWISVEDRLPAEYESVLAYGAKRLEWAVMRYSAKEGWEVDDCSEFHNAYPPKFWRALPAAPSNSPVGAKEQDK